MHALTWFKPHANPKINLDCTDPAVDQVSPPRLDRILETTYGPEPRREYKATSNSWCQSLSGYYSKVPVSKPVSEIDCIQSFGALRAALHSQCAEGRALAEAKRRAATSFRKGCP